MPPVLQGFPELISSDWLRSCIRPRVAAFTRRGPWWSVRWLGPIRFRGL